MTESRRRAVRTAQSQTANPANRIASHISAMGGLATLEHLAQPAVQEDTPELDDGDDDGFDVGDDIDDDDDDDDDDDEGDLDFDTKIALAGSPESTLTDARISFIRHKGKLILVAQIEDILPVEEGDEDEGEAFFSCDGSEMFEGSLILNLREGYGEAKKPLPPIDSKFFKKRNFVTDVPAVDID